MVVTETTLAELAAFAIQQPLNSITGAMIKSYTGNRELLFYGGGMINFLSATVSVCRKPGDISGLDYISGGSLFTHATNFKKHGLLPEEYFLYWEETDWCYSAKQDGYRLTVCTSAICLDKISSVIGKSFMADYYYSRNGLLFISKYRRKNIFIVLFFMWLRFFKRIFQGRWKRAGGVLKGSIDYFKWKPDESK
jgi:GT2 family glycosyltransferase